MTNIVKNIENVVDENIQITKETVKKYICESATEQELMLFIQKCKALKLNPFLREIYLVKYKDNPAATIIAKDSWIKNASAQPDYRGYKAGIIVKDKKDGSITKTDGFYDKDTHIVVGGWCTVYRKNKEDFTIEVPLHEYIGLKSDGTPNKNWSGKAGTMIRKVGIVQGIRECFSNIFSGIYDESEVDAINNANGFIDTSIEFEDFKDKIEGLTAENFDEGAKIIGREAKEILNQADYDSLVELGKIKRKSLFEIIDVVTN